MPLFVGVISILMLTANSWHVIAQWMGNKPNTLFTGIAHYYADYFLYISQIVQGSRGAWIFTQHRFTNEPLAPTWIYWFNVLMGKWTTLGINPFTVYNLAIIVLGGILLWLAWMIIREIFPGKPIHQLIAFLLTVTASNFTDFKHISQTLVGDFWFSPTPALNRLGGVPHQIFQTILLLLVILLFNKLLDSSRRFSIGRIGQIGLLVGLSFLAATANPIHMLLVCMAIVFTSFYKQSKGISRQNIFLLASILVPALIGATLTNAEFARQPILAAAKAWEDAQHVSVHLFQFWFALGPIGFLFPFGIIPFIKNLSPIRLLLGTYGLISIIVFLSPVPKLLGTTAVRWISPASYILLPILAAEGLIYLAQALHRATKKALSVTFWCTSILVLFIVFTIPAISTQIQTRTTPLVTDSMLQTLNHVPDTYIKGLLAIQQIHKDGVVLTDPTIPIDVLVPVFTQNKTFTGHPIHTLYPAKKEELRQKFFAGAMNQQEASQFIADHRIVFIISSTSRDISFLSQLGFIKLTANTSFDIFVKK